MFYVVPQLRFAIHCDKKWVWPHLGRFFTNSSGHPVNVPPTSGKEIRSRGRRYYDHSFGNFLRNSCRISFKPMS
jgi:hypothetical protein